MRRDYDIPKIEVRMFLRENVVRTSSLSVGDVPREEHEGGNIEWGEIY